MLRRNKDDRVHFFNSPSDLKIIREAYDTMPSGHANTPIRTRDVNNNDKSGNTLQWLTKGAGNEAFKAGFLNSSSLKLHIQQFKDTILNDPSYHVIGVAETRLGPTVDDNILHIDVYSIIRQDRNTEGGGVLLYVRNTLRATILASSDTTQLG